MCIQHDANNVAGKSDRTLLHLFHNNPHLGKLSGNVDPRIGISITIPLKVCSFSSKHVVHACVCQGNPTVFNSQLPDPLADAVFLQACSLNGLHIKRPQEAKLTTDTNTTAATMPPPSKPSCPVGYNGKACMTLLCIHSQHPTRL